MLLVRSSCHTCCCYVGSYVAITSYILRVLANFMATHYSTLSLLKLFSVNGLHYAMHICITYGKAQMQRYTSVHVYVGLYTCVVILSRYMWLSALGIVHVCVKQSTRM